jgi:AraC-like DNA-binding protein
VFTSAVQVLWIARYDYQRDWQLLRHEHEYFQMICFLSGAGQFTLDEADYAINPGSLFLIKPHCFHGLLPLTAVKTLDIKFLVTDRSLQQLLLASGDRVEDKDLAVAGLFEHIRREGEEAGHLHRELCAAYLTQILIHFLRLQKEASGKTSPELEPEPVADPVTQRALEFISAHYAEDLDLQHIARAVQKSGRYLRLRFEEFVGMSPMRYLLHYRIQKSKDLIRRYDYALKQVSQMVGFKSVHHFARSFHEVCGETPGSWRRKYQAGICKDICVHPQFSNKIWTVRRAG